MIVLNLVVFPCRYQAARAEMLTNPQIHEVELPNDHTIGRSQKKMQNKRTYCLANLERNNLLQKQQIWLLKNHRYTQYPYLQQTWYSFVMQMVVFYESNLVTLKMRQANITMVVDVVVYLTYQCGEIAKLVYNYNDYGLW